MQFDLYRDVGESGIGLGHRDGVWHFQDRTNRLFRGYIDMFLKKEQEASGWPGWCQSRRGQREVPSRVQRQRRIDLDRNAIQYNAGARTVWKYILNNFWWKMGQRPNRPKTKVVLDPKEYFELLSSAGMEMTNANIINDERWKCFMS